MLSVNNQTFCSIVLESSQPVLVHFWAPWCGLCLLIHPLLSKVQSEWNGPLKVVSVNADENFKLANTYRLRNLPTLILFNQGQIIHRLEGIQGRDELLKNLKGIRVNSFVQSA